MSTQHGKMKVRTILQMPQIARAHAMPLTVDEFTLVQRHYPIVFSVGENPIPIALMGLNEGVNVFLDDDGRPHRSRTIYIPAYIRRYPFLLARLRPDSDELSLCFDPTAERGRRVRARASPCSTAISRAKRPRRSSQFCEQFEAAGQRTAAFMEDLNKSDLLMDGEVAIQPEGFEQPFVYRGFRMVDEEKLRNFAAMNCGR